MITISFTEEEIVEVANHTAFTAFHSLEDDDEEAWRTATLAVCILDKIEKGYPSLIESDNLYCAREMLVLRKRVAAKTTGKSDSGA